MESLIVSPLLKLLYGRLTSTVLGEMRSRRDFKEEMEKLKKTLPLIQAVMEDAETRQMKDKKVRAWLVNLNDVANDADYLLDEISTIALRKRVLNDLSRQSTKDLSWHQLTNSMERIRQYEDRDRLVREILHDITGWNSNMNIKERIDWTLRDILDRTKYKVHKTSSTLKSIPAHYNMPRKLKEIRGRLDDVAKEISSFQFKQVPEPIRRLNTMQKRETGPAVDESKIYGRDEDLENMVEIVLSSDGPELQVVPIVGIGGIGKTTFARLVYKDPRVTSHFEHRIWVSVNHDFIPQRILSEVHSFVSEGNHASLSISMLQSQLAKSLSGKRFLLVLDDVWNVDQDEWDEVINTVKGAAAGSKIVLSTRSEAVAVITSAFSPYHLQALSKEDCLELFKQRAFADGEVEDFHNLLQIGEQIIEKCKGVPLVAKLLGSLLRSRREESEWSHVQRSELWSIMEGENSLLRILRLSYDYLPSHLKPCFAYCAVFPKNYGINKEKLIQQWIAHELIHCQGHLLEFYGSQYFDDLLGKSFFQAMGKPDDRGMTEFRMHDLIHDLAKYVSGDEYLTLGQDNEHRNPTESTNDFLKARHASVVYNSSSDSIPDALYQATRLRTLNLLSPRDDSLEALPTIITSFKHLKVLNISGCGIKGLHDSIGGLIYLRYIDLSNTLIATVPATVCDLVNLQTLNLSSCSELMELPGGIRKLRSLRHLNIDDCARLTHMPPFIGQLSRLQTLPLFIVGPKFENSLVQLLQLSLLHGKLKIKHLENVDFKYIDPRCIAKWMSSIELCSLDLLWGNASEGKSSSYTSRQTARESRQDAVDVLYYFEPNGKLRKLSINGYSGTAFPLWMSSTGMSCPVWMSSSKLNNLTQLNLINCKSCDRLPTLGELPALKILNIQGMDSVVHIGDEFKGAADKPFPSLKELKLKDFPVLQIWKSTDSAQAFTCLDRLVISKCPSLVTMPWFPSLQYLELQNCHQDIVWRASDLNSLSTLIIDCCQELFMLPNTLVQNNSRLMALTITSWPKLSSMPEDLGNLTLLKSLKIGWCDELRTLPHGLRNLTSLENLEIIECPCLIRLPEEGIKGLCSLRSLSIENCPQLKELPIAIKHVTALENLTIMFCSRLVHLPNAFQYLSELRSLAILSCPNLTSLPEGLQHVKKLQSLELRSCMKLMELPEWVEHLVSLRSLAISDCPNIKFLPKGLRRLSTLQHLSIRDCPDLEKHCERGTGVDWEKISHIPYIYVESSASQQGPHIASTSQNP